MTAKEGYKAEAASIDCFGCKMTNARYAQSQNSQSHKQVDKPANNVRDQITSLYSINTLKHTAQRTVSHE